MSKEEVESNYEDIDNLDIPLEEEEDEEGIELDRGDSLEPEEEEEESEGREEETEEEALEEGEPEGSEDESTGGGEDTPENKIPLSRLNQVIAQRDEQKDRVAWLESQLEKSLDQKPATSAEEAEVIVDEPDPYDFEAAEEKYQNLFLEGETKEATALRSEIRKAERDILTAEIKAATEQANEAAKSVLVERDFNDLVNALESEHPFLDSSHEDYNEEAVSMVNSLMDGYSSSMDQGDALTKAVKKLAPLWSKEVGGEEEGEASSSLGKKTKSKERKIASRKKAADTLNKQPAALHGKATGVQDMGDVNVESLSDRDFNKLSLKELKALRGD